MARLGFCCRGVVYVVIGLIALQIVRNGSTSGADASKSGALREIAERSFGRLLLLVLAVGLAGYAAWRLSEAIWGKRDEDDERKRTAKRLLSAGKALLLVSAVRFTFGGPDAGGGGGDQQEETMTARLLDLPGGWLVVGGIAAGLVVGGTYVLYRALSQEFEERLDTSEMGPVTGRLVDVTGTIGLAARALIFWLAGFVLAKAALEADAEEANGIDGTLKLIARQSYGAVVLTVVAVCLVAYGVYSFAEARYRQL
jgi:hypothetical protein